MVFQFPYTVDKDQTVAKSFKAQCTPDFFLFDKNQELVYRGQMDGSRPGNDISVTGVDIREDVVKTINQGKIHIVEPDLDGLVHHVVKEKHLKAATKPVEADVYLIAVPTPFKDNHVPDLSYVLSATKNLIPTLKKGALVILESTSPVGTTEKVQKLIFEERPELKGHIHIAYCPERVLPGNVLHELKHNDRAIGGINKDATEKAIAFYKHFVVGELHATNAKTAEMVKLVENASRDNQIAFANEQSPVLLAQDRLTDSTVMNCGCRHERSLK